jgi:hypothetical protein
MIDQKKISLVFLIVLMLFLSSCQMDQETTKIGEINNSDQSDTSPSTEQPQEVIYQVGDIISVNETILVILGWDQPPGGDLNPPDEGKQYLVVDLMIGNQGDRSFNVTPAFQMTLKDSSGQKYNINAKANVASGSNTPNGEVNPGEIIRGKVGFHVPVDRSGFIFVYEANLIGLGEVSVELGSTPVAMDPPSDLNLVNQQEIYQIGELVEISDLSIQVLGVSYPEGVGIVQPKEGFKFVSVDVQITNQGEVVQEITSVVQMYLKDSTGQQYTFNLGAQSVIDSGLPDDELQPGEMVRGQIGFQVPTDIQNLIYVFDADLFGFGKIFISLDQ